MIEIFFIFIIIIHIIILNIKNNYKYNLQYNSLSKDKQNYFVKNLFKSYFLFFFSIIGTYYAILGYYYNIWDSQKIHAIGLLYSAVDCYGLLTIKNMSITTIMHHTVVIILSICNLFVLYPNNTTNINLMVLYTLFSAYSFLVNYYLANRLLYKINQLQNTITLAYFSYIFNCTLNWSIHLYVLIYDIINYKITILMILYFLLIFIIINDDIVLIQFLKYQYYKLKTLNE
jgi:hypothetical protein